MNQQAIEEMKEKKKPSVSSEESAILADIIRNRGMLIADGNFNSEEDKKKFLDKFDMGYHYEKFNHAMSLTKNEDPEIVEVAFTEALRCSSYIDELARSYKPSEWIDTGVYTIYDALKEIPDRITRDFVVITNPKEGRADVIMPEGAFVGGKVVMPDGKTRNFFLSPDEVMPAEERNAKEARIINNELQGMSKQRIAYALQKQGAKYVRFFNTGGIASFRPNDSYFDGKRVAIAKLNQWVLTDVQEMNVAEAVERSRSVNFDRVQMIRDDANRWVLYMAPMGEEAFCMHPDKADINQFFSTSKQGNSADTERIRRELGQKYYAMSHVNPNLKIDMFGEKAPAEDIARVVRANVYKTKDGKFLISPVFNGMENVGSRPITNSQWQRLWLSSDINAYKNNMAALIYADLLHPQQAQEQKQAQEAVQTGGMRR